MGKGDPGITNARGGEEVALWIPQERVPVAAVTSLGPALLLSLEPQVVWPKGSPEQGRCVVHVGAP